MNYIILDMEWNQPAHKSKLVKSPVNLYGEVVRMGAVKINEKLEFIDDFKISVKPEYYTKIHSHVKKITGLTNNDLNYGYTFAEAYMHFMKWCKEDYVFLTWGYDDVSMLKDNMLVHGINADSLAPGYNLQVIFDDQIAADRKQCSLSYAAEAVGEVPFQAHDALSDAMTTYCVCRHLNIQKGIEDYKKLRNINFEEFENYADNAIYHRLVGSTYPTRNTALKDKQVNTFICPDCGATVKCKNWFTQHSDKRIAMCTCPGGSEYFVRIKFSKNSDGKFTAKQIVYSINADERKFYKKKFMKKKTPARV